MDSSEDMSGTITGGNESYYSGGCVTVDYEGEFILESGNIIGNHSDSLGAGVYVEHNGVFIMTGGEISGNSADLYGGGVFVENEGLFIMRGGRLTGNTAGIYGKDVYLSDSARMMASGDIVIDDLCLQLTKKELIEVDQPLGDTASIGLSVAGSLTDSMKVTSGFDGIGRDDIFHSNSSNSYSTGIDGSGEVFLGRTVWVSFDANGGSGSMKQKAVAAGSVFAPPVCLFTPPVGKEFDKWQLDGADLRESIVVDDDMTLSAVWKTTWKSLQDALTNAEDQTVLTLDEDVTASETDSALLLKGKTITLDLNGHTLSRGLTKEQSYGHAIQVGGNGHLIIEDTSEEGSGLITGGCSTGMGGGIQVWDSTVTLNAGAIAGNRASRGGGVCVFDTGTLIMNGGTITNNAADAKGTGTNNGGGVHCEGELVMNGGKISSNTTSGIGGGVDAHYGIFRMSGGEVSGNTAANGRPEVIVSYNDAEVSGSAVIGDVSMGIYRRNCIAVKDVLTAESRIGISYEELQDDLSIEDPHTFTNGLPGKGSIQNFYSSDSRFALGLDQNGEGVIGMPVTISFEKGIEEAGGNMESVTYADGSFFELPECGFTEPAEGMTFIGWVVGTDIVNLRSPGDMVEVDGDLVLSAAWMTDWVALQEKISKAENGDIISLTDHVVAARTDRPLVIPSGKAIAIDLCGYSIDRAREVPEADGQVMTVSGTLIVMDSSIDGRGAITGGKNTGDGGGVVLSGKGSFTLEGGQITGNSAQRGGGIFADTGRLELKDGKVVGNTAQNAGADICARLLRVEGTPVVGETVFRKSEGDLIEVTGTLMEGASIGVTLPDGERRPEHNEQFAFTKGLKGNGDYSHFKCLLGDDYTIGLTRDGEAALAKFITISFDKGHADSTGNMESWTKKIPGVTYETPECGFSVPPGNWDFDGWQVGTNTDEVLYPGDDAVFFANTVLTAKWTTPWKALQSRINHAKPDQVITLKYETVADSDDTALVVPEDKTITIDLNGHTIDRNLKSPIQNGYTFLIEGSLTIEDNKGGGRITGGNNTGDIREGKGTGGGFEVAATGSLLLKSGEISGNRATAGAGVHVVDGGSFTMTGGKIVGNAAENGRFNYRHGGGIFAEGALTMSGGEVSGNTNLGFQNGNVDIEYWGQFAISGKIVIGQVFVDNEPMTVKGPLSPESRIGTFVNPYLEAPVVLTSGLPGNGDELIFTAEGRDTSIDFNYIGLNIDGEAFRNVGVTVTFDPNHADGSMESVKAALDGLYILPECGFTMPLGTTGFRTWQIGGEERNPGERYLLTKDTTVKAMWSMTWKSLRQAILSPAATERPIWVSQDLKAEEDDLPLLIPLSRTFTLDLEGYKLDYAGEEYNRSNSIIEMQSGARFTLNDSVGTGVITGAWYAPVITGEFGAGDFTMNGGTISGNTFANGAVQGLQRMVMNGGSIKDNRSDGCGGVIAGQDGVQVFLMKGGSITGNSGGTEDGESAPSAGGVLITDGSFEISGWPEISKNTYKGVTCNVVIPEEKKIEIRGPIAENASIGLTFSEELTADKLPRVFTNGLEGRGKAENFVLDDMGKGLQTGISADGEGVVGTACVVKFEPGEGSGRMPDMTVAAGCGLTLPKCTFYAPENKSFAGWKVYGKGNALAEGEVVPITNELTIIIAYWGDGIEYIDENDTPYSQVIFTELNHVKVPDENGVTLSGSNGGWYAVTNDVDYENRITIDGDVNLILCDGATLNANSGIRLIRGRIKPNSLTIWCQKEKTGELVAEAYDDGHAGIGGSLNEAGGSFVMHGGIVTAYASDHGAGIGGGEGRCGGPVTIYGGDLYAEGYRGGAGIGGGLGGSQGGEVTVWGGKVEAIGGDRAAGIGGGQNYQNELGDGEVGGNGGSVSFWGGNVVAEGGYLAAGIGGGEWGAGCNISVGGNAHVVSYVGEYSSYGKGGEAIGTGAQSSRFTKSSGAVVLTDDCEVIAGETERKAKVMKKERREEGCRMKYAEIRAEGGFSYKIHAHLSDRYEEERGSVRILSGIDGGEEINELAAGEPFVLEIKMDGECGLNKVDATYTPSNGMTGKVLEEDRKETVGLTTYYYYTMPAGDVDIEVDLMARSYVITVDKNSVNGEIVAPGNAIAGERVTIISKPDRNYWMNTLVIRTANTGKVITPIMGETERTWDFFMPAEDVIISASFHEAVSFINKKGEWDTCKRFETEITKTLRGGGSTDGWYVISGKQTISDRVEVKGWIKLILVDGAEITFKKGIFVDGSAGGSLDIYAQEGPDDNLGKLIAYSGTNNAAIGGNEDKACGKIGIYGGDIHCEGGSSGAGIGGGEHGKCGAITITRGEIYAEGGNYAAGIGGGEDRANGPITISGGIITAKAGKKAAAIGSGEADAGDITITGGTVTATATYCGAGIGSGDDADGGTVLISGGEVTATGGEECPGIGGDYGCGKITITGGTVTATGGETSSGIGGGTSSKGSITISGGDVTAKGGEGDTTGIGGDVSKGSIGTVEISGGKVLAVGKGVGAGIGGGMQAYGADVTITGGFIEAQGGAGKVITNMHNGSKHFYGPGKAIGASYFSNVNKTLAINYPGSMLYAGKTGTDCKPVLRGAEGYKGDQNTCINNRYVKIDICNHGEAICKAKDEKQHTGRCLYCLKDLVEDHRFDEKTHICPRCGYSAYYQLSFVKKGNIPGKGIFYKDEACTVPADQNSDGMPQALFGETVYLKLTSVQDDPQYVYYIE